MEQINDRVILDSSALIAFIVEEKGSEIIQQVLSKAIMSSVNVAEVAKYFIEKDLFSRQEIELLLHQLLEDIISFDVEQSFINAELILETKKYGLSLGDRACIGLGLTSGHAIYTTDKIWKDLKIDNINIILIR